MTRQHKIAILKYTTRNFWLLLIPLVRGLVAMKFDLYHWLQGAYLDIIVILAIFGFAVLRWWFVQYQIQENGILMCTGMIVRNEYFIPYSVISCASAKRALLLRPVKAVTVALDSDSHSVSNKHGKADVELVVTLTDYTKLYNKIPIVSTNTKITYEASKGNLVFFSLLFSSTLSGVIFIGAFFIQGSRLVGRELEERFLSVVNGMTEFMQSVVKGVTPLSAALTLIIAAGWLLSFITNLLRHFNFKIKRRGSNIFVENGFFSRWKYYVNISKVNYADLRQNLLMKICRVMSVHVSCTGYGKSRSEIPVFVPITTRQRVLSSMQMMLPDFTMSNISLRPKKTYVMGYIWVPLVMSLAFPVGAAVLIRIFPGWADVINFLGAMAEIPSVYLLIVKIAAKFTSGIGVGEGTVTLKYCKFSQFHAVIVPKSRIAYVRIRRSLFQRVGKCCDVWVYTRGERAARHRIRGINVDEAEKFAENYDKTC